MNLREFLNEISELSISIDSELILEIEPGQLPADGSFQGALSLVNNGHKIAMRVSNIDIAYVEHHNGIAFGLRTMWVGKDISGAHEKAKPNAVLLKLSL